MEGPVLGGPLLKEPAGNTISGLRRWAMMGDTVTSRRGVGKEERRPPNVGK